jgi:hypothetical protein
MHPPTQAPSTVNPAYTKRTSADHPHTNTHTHAHTRAHPHPRPDNKCSLTPLGCSVDAWWTLTKGQVWGRNQDFSWVSLFQKKGCMHTEAHTHTCFSNFCVQQKVGVLVPVEGLHAHRGTHAHIHTFQLFLWTAVCGCPCLKKRLSVHSCLHARTHTH